MFNRLVDRARSLARSAASAAASSSFGSSRRRTPAAPLPPLPPALFLPLLLALLLASLLILLELGQSFAPRSPELPLAPSSGSSSPYARWLDPALVDRPEDLAFGRTCGQAGLLASGTAGYGPSTIGGLPFGGELRRAASKGALKAEPDGLLRVEPASTAGAAGERFHPALRLLADAERALSSRLDEQSTTYELAEAHYRKRYRRAPPPGFEKWWAFVKEHDVMLPDTHAATDLLAPFYALSSAERRRRLERASTALNASEVAEGEDVRQGQRGLFVIRKDDEGLSWSPLALASFASSPSSSGPIPKRVRAHLALLAPVAHLLPPSFTAVLNTLDEPVVLLDPKVDGAIEDPTELASRTVDWHALCGRREPEQFPAALAVDAGRQPDEIAFIQDARRASDPCLNPSLLRQHGFYLRQAHPAKTNGPPLTYRQLLPILSFASTPLHADVLLPAVGIEGVLDRPAADEPAWREKAGKLYWRGSATGMQNEGRPTAVGEGPRQRPWEAAHRPRLDRFANPRPSDGEVGDDGALYADPLNGRPSWAPTLAPEATNGSHRHASRPASRPQRPSTASISGVWKARWLDVHLAAGRWWRLFAWWPEKGQQCSWADGSCSALANGYSYVGKDAAGTGDRSKFVLDVDGNAWSARFPRLMGSRSLVLKATAFTEWNGAGFPAHVGYVPVNVDYSDIHSVLALFKQEGGTPADVALFDDVARRIADAGRCWAARTTRVVDMQAYMIRLYLEWARLFGEEGGGEDAGNSALAGRADGSSPAGT